MARIRDLKPSFFRNEDLAALPHWVRLLFQGLWGLADRDGLLEDRPKRIGIDVFPYEPELPISDGLTMLHDGGFIRRYQAGEFHGISIIAFAKHQKPHPKEASNNFPKPNHIYISKPDNLTAGTVEEPCKPLNGTEGSVGSLAFGLLGNGLLDKETPTAAAPVKRARSSTAKIAFQDWLDSLGDRDAIPDDDPIFDECQKAKLPRAWIEMAWDRFAREMLERGKKQAGDKGWRAHFRNAVRSNWYRLWWIRDGQAALTTQGEQERMAQA